MTALPEGEHGLNHISVVNNFNNTTYSEMNTTYEPDKTPGEAKETVVDPQLVRFLERHDLMDMQQQIISSKLKLSHLQGVERSDLQDLCIDLHLNPSQKIRLKHAINSFQKRIVRKRIRKKLKCNSRLRMKHGSHQYNPCSPIAHHSNASKYIDSANESKDNNDNTVHRVKSKIVIVGQAAVGKTTLQKAMLGYPFEEGAKATFAVSSAHHKSQYKYNHMHMSVDYEIFDTPGLDRFCDIITLYLRGALAVLVVYDVCDDTSFVKAKWWIEYLDNHASGYDKIILIANKIDMYQHCFEDESDDDDETSDSDIIKEGRLYATERGIAFLEISAKNRENVNVLLSWIDKQSKNHVANNPHKNEPIQLDASLLHRNTKCLLKFDLGRIKCCAV
eukprot:257219_1